VIFAFLAGDFVLQLDMLPSPEMVGAGTGSAAAIELRNVQERFGATQALARGPQPVQTAGLRPFRNLRRRNRHRVVGYQREGMVEIVLRARG
jgi:hypothetical protein